ncbi:SDR family oxidoreductase [Amycolatopsis rhizosphaerae]|uniref:SDR family oxidoreductase n=1 Tax=Amycolatopsis rhizosphaerae TaxID=2053003 RepID=A0A558D322_9PSEU|nr:SDR family oxidoreductase [Amycolatopsis rhizosphaerae]TVT55417.1 SDR family oxidoreductase [Amycolatopsis rhizosphaerae]
MGVEGWGILVTGGGGGIGLGVAKLFASAGAHVTVCGRTEEKLAEAVKVLGETAAPGARTGYVVADVTDEDAVAAAVEQTVRRAGGRLDGVVACAGGSGWVGPLTRIPLEAWRASVDTNLTGTLIALKHAAPVMAAAGRGSFVAVSSIAADVTHRWFGAYGVSKAGVDHLCRLAADELGPSNVRVNCIRPGLIRTGMVAVITDSENEILDDYRACTPLPRIGEPEDVALLARFLIGEESAWITGQVINVDGGHGLRRGPDFTPWLRPVYGEAGLRGILSQD